MKTIGYIFGTILMALSLNVNAQELAPDQNPNYMRSAEKYDAKSDELTSTQSETVQETYEAYDWREAKAEKKQQRRDRNYELRKIRYQNRFRCAPYPYRGFYNYPYGGFYNNNGFYGGPNCGDVLYGAGLGLGLYYLLN